MVCRNYGYRCSKFHLHILDEMEILMFLKIKVYLKSFITQHSEYFDLAKTIIKPFIFSIQYHTLIENIYL